MIAPGNAAAASRRPLGLSEGLIGMPVTHIVRVPVVTTLLLLLVYRHRHRFA